MVTTDSWPQHARSSINHLLKKEDFHCEESVSTSWYENVIERFSSSRKPSLSQSILSSMTAVERQAYYELNGCSKVSGDGKRRVYGATTNHYPGAVEAIDSYMTTKASRLKVPGNSLSRLPACIFNERLTKLDCSYNEQLGSLPAESRQCKNLISVDLSNTSIQEFDFSGSTQLREVTLSQSGLSRKGLQETISKGLPVGREVIIRGLQYGREGWPANVTVNRVYRDGVRDTPGKISITVNPPTSKVKAAGSTAPKGVEETFDDL